MPSDTLEQTLSLDTLRLLAAQTASRLVHDLALPFVQSIIETGPGGVVQIGKGQITVDMDYLRWAFDYALKVASGELAADEWAGEDEDDA